MMKAVLPVLFLMILDFLNPCDARPPSAQAPINTLSAPKPSQTSNPPHEAAQQPTAEPPSNYVQNQTVATSPATPSSATNTPPADIASLVAKEVLAANNQAVNQVASMYQNLGLFITIIVTLVGGVATWMSYVARKSVHEFIQEWTEKVKSLENDMKEDLKRLRNAVTEAEGSAKKAAEHERSIEDSKSVLNQILNNYDRLRAALPPRLRNEEDRLVSEPATETPSGQPPQEETIPEEEAEVAARLRGKIDPSESEGQNS